MKKGTRYAATRHFSTSGVSGRRLPPGGFPTASVSRIMIHLIRSTIGTGLLQAFCHILRDFKLWSVARIWLDNRICEASRRQLLATTPFMAAGTQVEMADQNFVRSARRTIEENNS